MTVVRRGPRVGMLDGMTIQDVSRRSGLSEARLEAVTEAARRLEIVR